MGQDIFYMSLIDIAEKIHQQEMSSVEVTSRLLERIDYLDDKLRSYVTILKQEALEAARQADMEITQGNSVALYMAYQLL